MALSDSFDQTLIYHRQYFLYLQWRELNLQVNTRHAYLGKSLCIQLTNDYQWIKLVTTPFEKLPTLNKNSKCVKFGTKSTHFNFFSKCVNISHINALWKRNFAWLALFILFQNFKDNYKFWKMNRSLQTFYRLF